MEELIQKYGKQFVSELMNKMIINEYFVAGEARQLLLKYKIIKPSTKNAFCNIIKDSIGNYMAIFYNGRNQIILKARFTSAEVPKILEMLK